MAITDAHTPARTISKRFDYVELAPDGQGRVAGPAPYLDYEALQVDETSSPTARPPHRTRGHLRPRDRRGRTPLRRLRWAADKQLRDEVCDFAGDFRHANPWAADLYRRATGRGHDHQHAVLARAWLYVIWHCWQDGVAYDPAKHRALQARQPDLAPAA